MPVGLQTSLWLPDLTSYDYIMEQAREPPDGGYVDSRLGSLQMEGI